MSAVEPGLMAAPGLLVYWFGSDLFYANIDRFATQARKLATESPSRMRWFVVDAGAITRVDYTAGGTLKELHKDLAKHEVALVFAHISESLKADLDRQGLTEVIGPNRQYETLRECLAAYEAQETAEDPEKLETCDANATQGQFVPVSIVSVDRAQREVKLLKRYLKSYLPPRPSPHQIGLLALGQTLGSSPFEVIGTRDAWLAGQQGQEVVRQFAVRIGRVSVRLDGYFCNLTRFSHPVLLVGFD